MYAEKFKIKKEKMMKKLWGDNFYNSEEKKWTKVPSKGSERGFSKFVLEPVIKVNIVLPVYTTIFFKTITSYK
jgi:elongation factor 2